MPNNIYYQTLTVDLGQLGSLTFACDKFGGYTNTGTTVTVTSDDETLNFTETRYFKVWVDKNSTSTEPAGSNWQLYGPTSPMSVPISFTEEGENYVHFIWMDEVGNKSSVINAGHVFYDKTPPVLSTLTLANNALVITSTTTTFSFTGSDTDGSGIATIKVTSSQFPGHSGTSYTQDITYNPLATEYSITFADVMDPTVRENRQIQVTLVDKAGNESSPLSASTILYMGGIDPVIVPIYDNKVVPDHTNIATFDLHLQVLIGDPSLLEGYKVWGDWADTGSAAGATFGTNEPDTFTNWPVDPSTGTNVSDVALTGKYWKIQSGNLKDSIYAQAKFNLGVTPDSTYATKAALEAAASVDNGYYVMTSENNDIWRVFTTTPEGGTPITTYTYYGRQMSGEPTKSVSNLETSIVHFSQSAPTITIGSQIATRISDKTGKDTTGFTVTFTDDCGAINEYKCIAYASQADAQASTSSDVTNLNLSGVGDKSSWVINNITYASILNAFPSVQSTNTIYFVVWAKDLCGNWGHSPFTGTIVVIDLDGPTGSITTESYYNSTNWDTSNFTVAVSDPAGVYSYRFWIDNQANNEEVPSGTPAETVITDTLTSVPYDKVYWNATESNTTYAHMWLKDTLDNTSVIHSVAFCYDKTAPTLSAFILPAKTSTTSVVPTSLTASDALSGMGYVTFSGDIVNFTVNGTNYVAGSYAPWTSTPTIHITTPDGSKSVTVLVKDLAGNIIAQGITATTVYDSTPGTPTLEIHNSADTDAIVSVTNTQANIARIGMSGASTAADIDFAYYKIWGDITSGSTEPETWTAFSLKESKLYMAVPITLTANTSPSEAEVVKTIYIKTKDDAGNVSQIVSTTVTLDTLPPEINMSTLTYNKISDQHVFRMSGLTVLSDYCDVTTHTFNCTVNLTEWKVCLRTESAGALPAEAVAIPTTGGSMNTSGGALAANTTITTTLFFADIDTAYYNLTGNHIPDNANTAVIIIIFGKDEAGNWSAAYPEPVTP